MRAWLAIGLAACIALLLALSSHAQESEPRSIGIAALLCLVIGVLTLTKGVKA